MKRATMLLALAALALGAQGAPAMETAILHLNEG